MKDSKQYTIDFDKLNKILENYECVGQLSFVITDDSLMIVEDTHTIEVKED